MNRNLARVARLIPAGGVRRYRGVMVTDVSTGRLAANVGGVIIPVTYVDPLIVYEGDEVIVDVASAGRGLGEAYVMGRISSISRPPNATVKTVPPGSSTITVTGSDGDDYTAYFVTSYAPVVNDKVTLAWAGSVPTVQGKIGTTPVPVVAPRTPVPPPPPPPTTGKNSYAATDSGTYTPGLAGWERWRGGGGYVHQGGIQYGYYNYGAWFYGGSPKQLAGRTITRISFTLGSRVPVGYYNAAATVHFYAHTSARKPAGDVSRVTSAYNVSIPAGSGMRTFDLPASWGATLLAGGGIAIAGEPYAAFHGRYTQPSSGLITLYWRR